jgi:hypothetical protein
VELQLNRKNLKLSSHTDILGSFIVPHELFAISRRNLILDTFTEFSYASINFSLIDLNESIVHIIKLGIFKFFLHFKSLFVIDEAENQRAIKLLVVSLHVYISTKYVKYFKNMIERTLSVTMRSRLYFSPIELELKRPNEQSLKFSRMRFQRDVSNI